MNAFFRSLRPLLRPSTLWRRYLFLENEIASKLSYLEFQNSELVSQNRMLSQDLSSSRHAVNSLEQDLRDQISNLQVTVDDLETQAGSALTSLNVQNQKISELNEELIKASLFGNPMPSLKVPSDYESLENFLRFLRVKTSKHELLRLGTQGDGGYVVPNILDQIDICFSAGVEKNSDFENDLADREIPSHLIDFSVEGPPVSNDRFTFIQKYLTTETVQHEYLGFSDWLETSQKHSKNKMLKMDIEGSEWRILENLASEIIADFKCLVVEFHWLHNLAGAWELNLATRVFQKLDALFDIVHVHPNNCAPEIKILGLELPDVFEVTFLRKDLNGGSKSAASIQSSLDFKNDPDGPDILLAPFWFK